MHLTSYLLTISGLFHLARAAPQQGNQNPLALPKFVMFGDSITEISSDSSKGFMIYPQEQNDYMRRLDLVARGFSGYTTAYAKYIIDPIIDAEMKQTGRQIDLMTVFFGANDAATNAHQHVPLDDYISNTKYIVDQAKKNNIKVILVAPGPVDEINGKFTDRSTETFRKYGEELGKLAEKEDVGFVNLWSDFMASLGWKEGDPIPGKNGTTSSLSLTDMLADGLHFKPAGYQVYYDSLKKEIASKYPELQPDSVTYSLPSYDKVDNSNIEKSLFPNGW